MREDGTVSVSHLAQQRMGWAREHIRERMVFIIPVTQKAYASQSRWTKELRHVSSVSEVFGDNSDQAWSRTFKLWPRPWYKNCNGCILLSTHFYIIPNTYTLSAALALLLCPFSISVLEDCRLQKTFQMTLKWELRLDKAKYGCALYEFDNVNSVNLNLEHRTSCGANIAGNVTGSATCIPSPSTNGLGNQANSTFVTSPESSNPNSVFIHLATPPESSNPDSGSTHFTRYSNCNTR